MSISPKPFFTLYAFYGLTACLVYILSNTTIAITYLLTGLISPFVLLLIYWLLGEL